MGQLLPIGPVGRNSVMERSLALFPGWQTGSQKLERQVKRRDFLGAIARADGAPLGEVELDVLTWLLRRWYEGRPEDGRITFTHYELAQALYGRAQGGRQNEIVRQALDHLHAVVITLSGVNILSGEFERRFQSKVHILSTLVIHEQIAMFEDEQSDRVAQGLVGHLRRNTIEVVLEGWLVRQLAGDAAVVLDWPIQRELNGLAKRLWVQLAALREQFEPNERGELELVMSLDDDAYAGLGIVCKRNRDCRAAVRRAASRILITDERYRSIAIEPVGNELEQYVLRIIARCDVAPEAVVALTIAPVA